MLFLQVRVGEKVIIDKNGIIGFIERRKNNKLIIRLPKEYKIYMEKDEQVQTASNSTKKNKA